MILAFLAMVIAEASRYSRNLAAQRSDLVTVDLFRRNIARLVTDQVSWKRIVDGNGSMGCLRTPNTPCGVVGKAVSNPNFDVFNPDGTPFYRAGSDARAGFDTRGMPCTGFSETSWTPDCPFRFDVQWFSVTGAPSSVVGVSINLKVSPRTATERFFIGNPLRYSIPILYRPAQLW